MQAWKSGFSLALKPDYELTLTEFPDPGGIASYFRMRDFSNATILQLFYRYRLIDERVLMFAMNRTE